MIRSLPVLLLALLPAQDPVVLRGHDGWVRCFAYSPTKPLLVSGGPDGTVRFWDTDKNTLIKTVPVGKG